MEAEREVSGGGDETHSSKCDLNGGIDQGTELRFFAGRCFFEGTAVFGENTRPEIEGVDILPVIDCLV